MDVPEEVLEQLGTVKAALEDLDTHMQPFLDAGPRQVKEQLNPLERVRAHLALAQAAVVLFQLHQRLQGARLDAHPLQKELERLANYEKKVQQAVTADELARTKPGTSLHINAANRFIDAAIPDLSAEQKAALRGLNKRGAAPAAAAAAGGGGGGSSGRASKRAALGGGDGDVAAGDRSSSRAQKPGRREQQPQQQLSSPEDGADGPGRRQGGKTQSAGPGAGRVAASASEFLAEVMADVEQQQQPAAGMGQG